MFFVLLFTNNHCYSISQKQINEETQCPPKNCENDDAKDYQHVVRGKIIPLIKHLLQIHLEIYKYKTKPFPIIQQ